MVFSGRAGLAIEGSNGGTNLKLTADPVKPALRNVSCAEKEVVENEFGTLPRKE
jgi:hypothetical protein